MFKKLLFYILKSKRIIDFELLFKILHCFFFQTIGVGNISKIYGLVYISKQNVYRDTLSTLGVE